MFLKQIYLYKVNKLNSTLKSVNDDLTKTKIEIKTKQKQYLLKIDIEKKEEIIKLKIEMDKLKHEVNNKDNLIMLLLKVQIQGCQKKKPSTRV